MREITRLTVLKVNRLKSPGRYADGAGLWLQIGPSGSKSWLFRYMIHGRARQMGLGALHTISLKAARERARQAREMLLDGKDPIDMKHGAAAQAKIEAAKRMTFKQCAEDFLRLSPVAEKWTNDTHRKQWRQSLEDYAFPTLGSIPVSQIDLTLIKKTLDPVWRRTPVTASRLRGRIELVLAYATASGLRSGDNPAAWRGNLKAIYGKASKQVHHAALSYTELPAFMDRLRAVDGTPARAAEFMILTAARITEAAQATWDEIDLDAKVWTIPAQRMKLDKPHLVPLAPAVCDLLKSLPRISGYVFPATKKAINRNTIYNTVKAIDGNVTPHGFRSSFRDWAGDRTAYPRDVIEFALAHGIPDQAEAAYRRYTALDKRRRLMSDWAKFLLVARDHERQRGGNQ